MVLTTKNDSEWVRLSQITPDKTKKFLKIDSLRTKATENISNLYNRLRLADESHFKCKM